MRADAGSHIKALAEIANTIVSRVRAGEHFHWQTIVAEVAKKYRMASIPKLVEVIAAIDEEHKKLVLPFLTAKPIRTASGIAVVALMSRPHRCPHIAFTGNIWYVLPARAVFCRRLRMVV